MLAFSAHPKLGDRAAIQQSASTGDEHAAASSREQERVVGTSDEVLADLMTWNQMYEKKFGHVFLLCAAGKSAGEVLRVLKQRCAFSKLDSLWRC
jgi:2-oxo-4-hydroxy-4-carboxy--5-ureidoimidazoline (OHCU) decarboxylase